ncbi:PEP-CTERM sorting domain-containing protein [Coraliomargarita akajimensis]|uniref:PEP-CTERM protein-sorting domain-containing protein n=1 Tax=Coraliomargarita akajimensis (strain DSM 45221 / IAM 15411 / JCM 23193 / KCTC 12865 / 04OKA010-24) TaxID=583355 RepID=D5EIM0_CORAD|nr:PEP-CTERM sorting domain-containing protein [Coraliomargarita akajimensis]ADE56141.1 protein of unknown function DUF1555 [Coraliomargarita akajimensis DSM 45221]
MKKVLTLNAAVLAASALTLQSLSAQQTTSFNEAGFTDNALNGQNGWLSSGFNVVNSATTGEATAALGGSYHSTEGAVSSIAVGETLSLTLDFSMTAADRSANVATGSVYFRTGGETGAGTADLAGVDLRWASNGTFQIRDLNNGASGGDQGAISGTDSGDLLRLELNVTKAATQNASTISGTIYNLTDSVSDTFSFTNVDAGDGHAWGANAYAASSLAAGFSYINNVDVDVFTVQQITTPVPEPGSFALLTGSLAIGSAIIRRRR